ncbi:uncharacterized protein XM38_032780 [Halomicronema hongdechloris C2206]|uniref:Uncharacterized protein n=1 Tax=Halomicronema hongdechloris C2206 TaxID=1641165 RepID=A0A1Z3HPT8_9CYAN|nr:hypothetical protein [Halomicronema hongdechloris]ASC72321.1 uncharacterized protein XM38_032780 [Halomicronema hongdechloris C2206]
MPFTPNPPFPKSKGDALRSDDWNQLTQEVQRLDTDKLNKAGDLIDGSLTISGSLAIGRKSPQAPLHLAGGNWDVSNTEGDLKIGDDTYRLKVGVATAGGGAGDVRIRAQGGTNRLLLGSGKDDVLTVQNANVGIGTITPDAKLTVAGALKFSGDGTLIFYQTNESGTPNGDGFRFRYDETFFGSTRDALVIEKTDGNSTDPDGGIAFVNTGNDGTVETSLAIRGDGRVGIGTTNPAARLHIEDTAQIGATNSTNGRLTIYGTGNNASAAGALTIRSGSSTSTQLFLDRNEVNCQDNTLYLNFWSNKQVRVGRSASGAGGMYVYGNLHATGNITAGGNKSGYVTDRFINQSGDLLDAGDVVVLGTSSTGVFYGKNDAIPVPEVDLTTNAYDHRVCGIVAEIVVEEPPEAPEAALADRSDLQNTNYDDGIKRLQVFSPEEVDKMDLEKVEAGQFGNMVTLGCFAYCKVDADIAPIEVGDLLTTSPTKGHAQKVLHPEKAMGTVLGKALATLFKGKGKIPVLVMLQ